jgi:signal transduction histidine kinase
LAVTAHELRTPLAVLSATVEPLAENPSLDEVERRRLLARLHNGVRWMNCLLDNLATWSAPPDERLALACRSVAVRAWLETAIGVTAPLLEQRGQRVTLACPTPEPWVLGDPTRRGQVVANRLTNASRYSVVEDVIAITVTADDGMVRVQVTDHGPRVPEQEQQRLLSSRVCGEHAQEVTPTEHGLGRHIVRRLVELHGGQVGGESVPGQGATYWFRVRRATLAHDEPAMSGGT